MKKEYSAPTIVRHELGLMNAQAHGQTIPVCDTIDGVRVEDLVKEHGSPLFVFSEATLRRTYRETYRAFGRRYPNVRFAWSYKTNYLKAICSVFHQEGAIAEVVSDFEYEKARALGIPGRDIIFNGPYKPAPALARAIEEGAKIQVDNMDELLAVGAIAEARNQKLDVALRVFMDCGAPALWSKFGFNADSTEAVQAIKHIRHHRYLHLTGLHTHVGTFILEPAIYTRAAARLVDLAKTARREYGFHIQYLNLGGGFASHNQLHYQYLPPEYVVPSMDSYAEAICRPILDRWPKGRKLPQLYLETGRALVDEAGYLITTIVALKSRPSAAPAPPCATDFEARNKSGYRQAAVAPGATGFLVDAGIHLLYTAAFYQLNVRPARAVAGPPAERTVYGCLCMNIDVLRESVALPNLNVGDQLVFQPVGAYNITQSMQFISYRPRVVLVTGDRQVEVIRDRENLDHVEALERLPERLRLEPAPREESMALPPPGGKGGPRFLGLVPE